MNKMARFKLVISTSDGRAKTMDVEGTMAQPLVGKRIGETVEGSIAGFAGEKFLITGGSDKDGFPMRRDVIGGAIKSIILNRKPGFRPKLNGERKRKSVRGNVVTDNIIQVNLKKIEDVEGSKKKRTKK